MNQRLQIVTEGDLVDPAKSEFGTVDNAAMVRLHAIQTKASDALKSEAQWAMCHAELRNLFGHLHRFLDEVSGSSSTAAVG